MSVQYATSEKKISFDNNNNNNSNNNKKSQFLPKINKNVQFFERFR